MLNKTIIALLSIILVVPLKAIAEQPAKIGFIDIQKVIQDSKAGKDARLKLEEFHSKRQKSIDEEQEKVIDFENEIYRQKFTLTDEALARKEQTLSDMKINLKRLLEDSERELERMQEKYFKTITEEITQIVENYGKSEGYDLIISKAMVLYGNPSVNLTERIIKRYDEYFTNKNTSLGQ